MEKNRAFPADHDGEATLVTCACRRVGLYSRVAAFYLKILNSPRTAKRWSDWSYKLPWIQKFFPHLHQKVAVRCQRFLSYP